MNYYNEIDPFAAAWLRKLIAAGHIAPGNVDERSIVDVRPDDLRGYRQCHFFAGIGGWSYALRFAGWPDDRPVWSGSCPCQPFSAAGKGAEFADDRHLWPAWFRLIRECRPDVVFGEQVSSKDALAWFDHVSVDLEAEGYAVGALDTCAAGVGAPHIRQRLYFVAHATDTDRRGRERAAQAGTGTDGIGRRGLAGSGPAGLVADPECGTAERHRLAMGSAARGSEGETHQRQRVWHDAGHGGNAIELGDTIGAGPQGLKRSGDLELHRGAGPLRPVAAPSSTVALADTGNGLFPQSRRGSEERDGPRPASENRAATNGFWSDAEWIACRDGKWRAVEPGVAPLASGLPNRVGRLRGYGNAINAPLAAEFIRAAVDAIDR